MLGVMFPVVSAGTASAIPVSVHAVAAVDIRVAVEIIVVVYGDVVVAAPAAAIAPTTAPCRSHGQPHTEGNRHACGVIARRRIVDRRIGINWRSIHDHGVIAWNIDNFRIGLLDNHHLFGFHYLGLYRLLVGRFQVAGVLRLFPHALNGSHHVTFLDEECVTQIRGPLNVIGEAFYDFRDCGQALNAWVPGLFRDRIRKRLVLQVFVLCQPLLELHDFQRIGRSSENLGEHRIRVKRNRRHQRIELIGR
jgi:hypothetical protein